MWTHQARSVGALQATSTQSIEFKLALLTHKAQQTILAQQTIAGSTLLLAVDNLNQSSDIAICHILRTNTKLDNRSFTVAGLLLDKST